MLYGEISVQAALQWMINGNKIKTISSADIEASVLLLVMFIQDIHSKMTPTTSVRKSVARLASTDYIGNIK